MNKKPELNIGFVHCRINEKAGEKIRETLSLAFPEAHFNIKVFNPGDHAAEATESDTHYPIQITTEKIRKMINKWQNSRFLILISNPLRKDLNNAQINHDQIRETGIFRDLFVKLKANLKQFLAENGIETDNEKIEKILFKLFEEECFI